MWCKVKPSSNYYIGLFPSPIVSKYWTFSALQPVGRWSLAQSQSSSGEGASRQYGVKTLRHNYSLGEFLRLCDYNAILSITEPPPPVWAPITRGKWTLTYICLQNASNLSVRFYKSLQLSSLSYSCIWKTVSSLISWWYHIKLFSMLRLGFTSNEVF